MHINLRFARHIVKCLINPLYSAWFCLAQIGSVPFLLSPPPPHFIDICTDPARDCPEIYSSLSIGNLHNNLLEELGGSVCICRGKGTVDILGWDPLYWMSWEVFLSAKPAKEHGQIFYILWWWCMTFAKQNQHRIKRKHTIWIRMESVTRHHVVKCN